MKTLKFLSRALTDAQNAVISKDEGNVNITIIILNTSMRLFTNLLWNHNISSSTNNPPPPNKNFYYKNCCYKNQNREVIINKWHIGNEQNQNENISKNSSNKTSCTLPCYSYWMISHINSFELQFNYHRTIRKISKHWQQFDLDADRSNIKFSNCLPTMVYNTYNTCTLHLILEAAEV